MIDFDTAIPLYKKIVETAYKNGAEIVVYSHGAPVITAYDGIWTPSDKIAVYLAQSSGQKEIMQKYGYPHPIEVVGWHFCKQKTFKPTEIKRVLFAPFHPHSNGYMMPEMRDLNNQVFRRLKSHEYDLTICHVGSTRDNNIRAYPEINYVQSDMSVASAVKLIDEHDLVVSYCGTFASLAIARGKPTVMFGQDIRPFDGYSDETLRRVESWESYRDLTRYPYDISNKKTKAARFLLEFASKIEAKDWRSRFIGRQIDEKCLIGALNKVMENKNE